MKCKIFLSLFVINIALYACNSNNLSSNNTTEKTSVNNIETPKSAIKGKVSFEQKCAACHGNNGMAGISNAANLHASKLDSISIVKTITEGKGGMPPFGSQLTKEEIADLSHYVLTLRK